MKSKDHTNNNQDKEIKTLLFGIENYRVAIADMDTSFGAMDTKMSIFISTLAVLTALLVNMAIDMEPSLYSDACCIIIYFLGIMLFLSILLNLFLGFMALKTCPMESGVVDNDRMDWFCKNETEAKIVQELYDKLRDSEKKNRKELANKSCYFSKAQTLSIANMVAILLFMLLLICVRFSYA